MPETRSFMGFVCNMHVDVQLRRGLIAAALGISPLLAASFAEAQETDIISTERPGFSSSPIALAPRLLQIEGGYQYTRDDGNPDFEDQTLPFALLRYGLADNLELQLSWAGHSWSESGSQSFNGANDAGIGVKWQLNETDATVPIALFAGLSVPIGDPEYSSDHVDPTLGVFWSHSANLDWFGTVIINESNDTITGTNAIGISLPINEEYSGFVEYFGNYAENSGPEHYLDGGISYLMKNNMQLDVNAGIGLNSRAADFFLGFGIAYRY